MKIRRRIDAYCDGACKKNPGHGGWGAIAIELSDDEISSSVEFRWVAYGGKKKTTNQEMELKAMLECLRICPLNSDIKITSDSKTVLGGLVAGGVSGSVKRTYPSPRGSIVFTGWIGIWRPKINANTDPKISIFQEQWKKADGKSPKSVELWKGITLQCEKHIESGSTLEFAWVKGHEGNEGNEIADSLANLGAARYK